MSGCNGLLCAKNKNLIVNARPKCSTTTTISMALLTCFSVALKTGYRFRSKKAVLIPKPTATKHQFRRSTGDQEIRATGTQRRLA